MGELIIGIDDAGRGPIIGPMILAGVILEKKQESFLKKQNITDSKLLFHNTRIKLAKIIKAKTISQKIVKTSPEEIDSSLSKKVNLNTLEAIKTAEIINALNTKKQKIKVIVDCPSVNTTAWQNKLLEFIKHPDNLKISCEHKADFNHTSVAAASILAKVTREEEISALKKKFGELGSGYPSDPTTKQFLEKQGRKLKDSGIFRKSWATWKNLFPEPKKGQSSLEGF
tara:strand:+ start:8367 stop:9047 length:681 start_codon:yes stop_codon:yes gene_type:complete